MRRLAVSLAKVPRSSATAIDVVAGAIRQGCDILLYPTHCGGEATGLVSESIKQAGGLQPGRKVYVSVGLIEGARKAELIARYGKLPAKGKSLPSVASIDEHSANCMEADCLQEELASACSALPDDCPTVALLQNPEDHAVSYLNEFSKAKRSELESGGQQTTPGGVLLPSQGQQPQADAPPSTSPPGQSLVDVVRAEAYRIQPELRAKVQSAFVELERQSRGAGTCSGYGVLSEGFGDPEALSGFSHEGLTDIAKLAAAYAAGGVLGEDPVHRLVALAMPGNPVERAALETAGADALRRGLDVLVTRPHAGRDRSGAAVPLLPAPDAADYGAVLQATMNHFEPPSAEEAAAAGLSEEDIADVVQACSWIRGYFDSMEKQRDSYTSPSHFEFDLATQVGPTLRDKVHSMDEDSAQAIARFIEAYGRRVAADSEARVREHFEARGAEGGTPIRAGEALDLYSLRWLKSFRGASDGGPDSDATHGVMVPVLEPMAADDVVRWCKGGV